ncbi:MAG: orotate phosphoribosyltransferase [Candidatus Dormibacteraceae bacterium]
MPDSGADPAPLAKLAADMVAAAYLEGDFVLRSGRRSTYYFDKYLFETRPDILRRLGAALAPLLFDGTERVASPELGAVLLGGAVSLATGLPLVLVRKGEKGYGTARLLEGRLAAGDRVTVIEDVLTTGGEAVKAVQKLKDAGATVLGLVGVVDREEGAAENLELAGIPFRALFKKGDLPIPSRG